MKQFKSIIEGIQYHPRCPLCTGLLDINPRDLADLPDRLGRLSWYVHPLTYEDILYIHPVTSKVEIIVSAKSYQNVIVGTAYPHGYHGLLMQALTIDCQKCCQFSYTMQVHVGLEESELIGVFLNSETISIDDGDMVHEIKNVYSAEVTRYSYFSKDGTGKNSELPLFPLDLEDPKKTIKKIRNLLIFI